MDQSPETGATNPLQDTAEPGSAQSQSDPLLAIILGIVGGLIALLPFAIILLICFRGSRKKLTSRSFKEDRYLKVCAIN